MSVSENPNDPERQLPADHRPLPALSGEPSASISAEDFHRIYASTDFQKLKSTFRSFAFPMTFAFLFWYFVYVLASTFAGSFMAIQIPGMNYLNFGLVAGLLQFVTTFLITWLYLRHANRKLDPLAKKLRDEIEEQA